MARQKLKKYRMAVGICGPTVLYTNIIKAYSPEDAARKYLEEGIAEGSVDEITDEKVAKIAKEMHELKEAEALTSHYDACGKLIEGDDTVIAAVNNTIVKGTVVKLTNRSIKIAEAGKEYTVTINRNDYKEISGERRPFFAKVVKVDRDTAGSTPEPGSYVAYLLNITDVDPVSRRYEPELAYGFYLDRTPVVMFSAPFGFRKELENALVFSFGRGLITVSDENTIVIGVGSGADREDMFYNIVLCVHECDLVDRADRILRKTLSE